MYHDWEEVHKLCEEQEAWNQQLSKLPVFCSSSDWNWEDLYITKHGYWLVFVLEEIVCDNCSMSRKWPLDIYYNEKSDIKIESIDICDTIHESN